MGDFELSLGNTKISIRDIFYVPELSKNLISIAQLSDKCKPFTKLLKKGVE